jgi:glycosyltransferase involved in cell wall biosynthesis
MQNLLWSGSILDPSGYGEASRNYVLGLMDTGEFNIRLLPRYFWQGVMPSLGQDFERLMALERSQSFNNRTPYICVQHLTPENFQIMGTNCRAHIGMTTFETDSVPAAWQASLRQMDELIVFSNFNREVFQEHGIRRPIHVVPHGVDINRYRPGLQPLSQLAHFRNNTFVFGMNFDWTERKNPKAVIQAYLREFNENDDVVLVLKSFHQDPSIPSAERIRSIIESMRQEYEVGEVGGPRIVLLDGIMSPADMAAFYAGLNCYVLPSRGEGWGLTFSEAMASELVVIGTGWSGNLDFMNDSNSVLLRDFKLVDIPAEGISHLYRGHKWADVNIEELSAAMRDVYENECHPKYVAMRRQARSDMVEQFSWEHAATSLASVLGRI